MAYHPHKDTDEVGIKLLRDPWANKGMAFSMAERSDYKLHGLLPPRVFEIETQMLRVLENLERKTSDLERYVYLIGLQDRNKQLFYHTLTRNIQKLMPIVYTPTVGEACQRFGYVFRRPRGLWVSARDRGNVRELVQNWPEDDVRCIVITDGERILGLGDLGAYGMGIPVGKLALYSACAGLHPNKTLPVFLDVGTNSEHLIRDPVYMGLLQSRIRGEEYDELVDEFITAVYERWPKCLVQWEDFSSRNAFRLLSKYRNKRLTFNDDIQGTASVTLAGLISAAKMINVPLHEQTFLFQGAGEAGTGIADLLVSTMMKEGLSEADAVGRCFLVDSRGLVVKSRDNLAHHKLRYAHDRPFVSSLGEAIDELKPTCIIGVSAQHGAFTPQILRRMAELNKRPIIFSLSNPTSKSECTAEEAYVHTDGRCVFASGSPFDKVEYDGDFFVPGQANNVYIFPGLALGVVAAEATSIPDEMLYIAAKTVSEMATDEDFEVGRVFPPLSMIREVSINIACAVATYAFENGLAGAGVEKPEDHKAMRRFIKEHVVLA